MSYSVVFAFVTENVSVMRNAHAPALLTGRLNFAHCKQINEFTNDYYGYIENAECKCKDIMEDLPFYSQ